MDKFSVLLPVYKNDTFEKFKQAVESVYDNQSVKPEKVVIVRDGPVPIEIQNFLEQLKTVKKSASLGEPQTAGQAKNENQENVFKIIELPKNSGLSNALNIGIDNIQTEIIARADSDDICLKDRFKEQLKKMDKYSVVSSAIQEFSGSKNGKILSLPQHPTKKYISLQTPIWHPAVMYKKSVIKKVGGYENIHLFEDYLLWAKLFMSGAKFYNIDKVLVKHRMDESLFKRRSGYKLFKSELILQSKFLHLGFINIWIFLRNIIIRGLYRFFPVKLKQLFNKKNIKQKLFSKQ